ncbi:hypothetical protein B9Z65_6414 [Elsinoe australis]|uniref:GH64 domain-containing protein n=1 Tax=Elsinoe australis TaxID=40998 RepID=A0A2P8A8J8_9PEZI|nr:hypothetical protein B9Z65_6414 [Elsinoe australis]
MPASIPFVLRNTTQSASLFAYVTGIALQHDSQRCLLRSTGTDLYFPTSPSSICSPLAEDCAIPLGPPGQETTLQIPQLAGGRLWISRDAKLTFLLNPGPALVEPSVLNPSDPNADIDFGFVEFTLNDAQLYANISYVDFVPRLPIAINLQTESGARTNVTGIPSNGIEEIASRLRDQAGTDGRPWDRLVVSSKADGQPLRVLNATHGNTVGANFDGYYEPYVDQVWQKYSQGARLEIDTQSAAGTVTGSVDGSGNLTFGAGLEFGRPSTTDIFGCNSGPFVTGSSQERNAIIPRLAAAFVRSTLLTDTMQPSDPAGYYKDSTTQHYCRIVHEVNADMKGYAFAYDDVQPSGGEDQSGKANAGDPTVFTVTLGGGH